MIVSLASARLLLDEGAERMRTGYRARCFCEDLFLFDGTGRILFSRCGFSTRRHELFYDHLSARERAFVLAELFSSRRTPLMLSDGERVCLIVRSAFASTGVFAACLVYGMEAELSALADGGLLGPLSYGPGADSRSGALPALDEDRLARLADFLYVFRQSFEETAPDGAAEPGELAGWIVERLAVLASLAGCPSSFSRGDEPAAYPGRPSPFDAGRFTILSLCLMLALRALAPGREVLWRVDSATEGFLLEASAILSDSTGELSRCEALADELELLFDRRFEGGRCHIRFCPSGKELSLLGLKNEKRLTKREGGEKNG